MKVSKEFLSKPPKSRKNSQNLRKFIYDLIEAEFDRDLDEACFQINKKVTAHEDRRDYDTRVQPASLKKILLDYHLVSYSHLSALARYCEVPMSLILLFTRIRDEIEESQKNGGRKARSIILGTIAYLDQLQQLESSYFEHGYEGDPFNDIGHSEFVACVDAYRRAYENSEEEIRHNLH